MSFDVVVGEAVAHPRAHATGASWSPGHGHATILQAAVSPQAAARHATLEIWAAIAHWRRRGAFMNCDAGARRVFH